MDVWNDDTEPGNPLHRRIRRFRSWKDGALFFVELVGAATIVVGGAISILSSMGFRFSGSGEAIAAIQAHAVVQDTAIYKLQRKSELIDSRTADTNYLVCELTKRIQPGVILPPSCK